MIEVLRLLHELEQSNSRFSTTYYVRHLDKLEPIPQFDHGIPESPLANREWIWVAYSTKDDSPLAILLAAPIHNVAMLLRAYATEVAPKSIWVGLFRKSLADILSRGYTTYAVWLSPKRKHEVKLARLIEKVGGIKLDHDITLYHGPTDISRW